MQWVIPAIPILSALFAVTIFRRIGRAEDHIVEHNNRLIAHLQGVIVPLVSVDQTVLDSIGDTLGGILDAVTTIVEDESNPLEAADLKPITDKVTALQEVLTKPETPVEPTPEPVPVEPPVDPTPAA